MTEQVGKVFLKKFNKKSEEITKCQVNRETTSLMYRQAVSNVSVTDVKKSEEEACIRRLEEMT